MILAMTSFSVNYYTSAVKLSGAQGIVSKNDEDDLLKRYAGCCWVIQAINDFTYLDLKTAAVETLW